jgi:hypothetical protein
MTKRVERITFQLQESLGMLIEWNLNKFNIFIDDKCTYSMTNIII